MLTTYDVTGQWYGLGGCKYCNISFIDDNAQKIKSGIWYNTKNSQMMWIIDVSYSTDT